MMHCSRTSTNQTNAVPFIFVDGYKVAHVLQVILATPQLARSNWECTCLHSKGDSVMFYVLSNENCQLCPDTGYFFHHLCP